MARPLRKTYSPTHPYVVERHDCEDGSITYEIWDHRPTTYRRVCALNEWDFAGVPEPDEDRIPSTAKDDAELIARALNLMNGGLPPC